MDRVMEFLPFLIPLVIAEFALLGYTLHHILTHNTYKRGNRTLWLIILVKLFIMFFILKIFFFPNFLGHLSSDKEKSEYVGEELIRRAIPPED